MTYKYARSFAVLIQSSIKVKTISSRHAHASISTLADIGIKSFPNTPVKLLPLLQTKESKTGPFPLRKLEVGDLKGRDERIPEETRVQNARVAFTINDESGGEPMQWLSTVHTFPSAWPRSHPYSTSPPSESLPKLNVDRAGFGKEEERLAREEDFKEWDRIAALHSVESFYPPWLGHQVKKLAEKAVIIPGGYSTTSRKRRRQKGKYSEPQLWSVVQRLVPITPIEGGVTLILAHANGFHKELYEPTMQSMLNTLSKTGPPIAEIWSLDSVDSGTAGVMNTDRLGLAVSWSDQSRDMLQFLDYYLPQQQYRSDQTTSTRRNKLRYKSYPSILIRNQQGVSRKARTVVGVGHSFNGAGMMLLSSIVPNSFDGVFIIDPVGVTPKDFPKLPIPAETPLARGAIARKDIFSSIAAAREYMKSRPFFTAWDPRVLDLHLQFGLHACSGHEGKHPQPVTLSQSRWREALAYSSYFLGTWSYHQLRKSQFKGWGHLICMSETNKLFFGEEGSAPLMERFNKHFSERATSEILKGGHLVVQEQPEMLGVRLAQILTEKMAS